MPDHLREFLASSNGDRWLLGRNNQTGFAYVVHRASPASGGTVTEIDLGAFLNQGPLHPQHQELLRLIGTLVETTAPTEIS